MFAETDATAKKIQADLCLCMVDYIGYLNSCDAVSVALKCLTEVGTVAAFLLQSGLTST